MDEFITQTSIKAPYVIYDNYIYKVIVMDFEYETLVIDKGENDKKQKREPVAIKFDQVDFL